jgi:thioredoxin-like negative regulator of GroEL
VIRLNLQEIF